MTRSVTKLIFLFTTPSVSFPVDLILAYTRWPQLEIASEIGHSGHWWHTRNRTRCAAARQNFEENASSNTGEQGAYAMVSNMY